MIAAFKVLDRYKIPYTVNSLKLVFTHSSFSEKNNSRHVFLGQFAFRGAVAKWMYSHIRGTGTQLQHALGNLFSLELMNKRFDDWSINVV